MLWAVGTESLTFYMQRGYLWSLDIPNDLIDVGWDFPTLKHDAFPNGKKLPFLHEAPAQRTSCLDVSTALQLW
jgi:hypothetical protein